jgi:hypothetical protein
MISHSDIRKRVSSGKFFSCKFTKRDGTERKMVARIGVKKGVKGIGRKFNAENKNLLSVFDVHKRQFRFINLNTLHQLKINNQIFK